MNFTKSICVSLLVVGSLSIGTTSLADEAAGNDAVLQALEDALPGTLMHNPLDLKWESVGTGLQTKVVKTKALPSGRAVSTRVKKKQNKPWDTAINVQVDDGIKKGEKIQVHYWARTKKAPKGSEAAKISLFVGRNEEPYDYIISEDLSPSGEWELKSVSGVAKADYSAGKIKAEYQLGKAAQTVEFGPVYVSTLGMAAPTN